MSDARARMQLYLDARRAGDVMASFHLDDLEAVLRETETLVTALTEACNGWAAAESALGNVDQDSLATITRLRGIVELHQETSNG